MSESQAEFLIQGLSWYNMTMFDQESIFYKKNQTGDVIINLNLSAARDFLWYGLVKMVVKPAVSVINLLYTSLNFASAHRPALFILSGLGFGFGLGLVVFQRPMSTLASPLPMRVSQASVTVQQLEIGNVSFEVSLSDAGSDETTIQQLATSAPLGKEGSLVLHLGWRSEATTYLENATLNDPLIVIGSNNGRYSYRVVEIKEVDNEMLSTLFNQTGKALVIYAPTNLLHTKYLVVIAR